MIIKRHIPRPKLSKLDWILLGLVTSLFIGACLIIPEILENVNNIITMEKDKHCFNCTHYLPGKLDFHTEKTSPRGCAAGHTELCNKWWEDNGKKKFADETIEELPCFEPTESAKFLDSMIDKVGKLNVAITKLVDEIKNNPA